MLITPPIWPWDPNSRGRFGEMLTLLMGSAREDDKWADDTRLAAPIDHRHAMGCRRADGENTGRVEGGRLGGFYVAGIVGLGHGLHSAERTCALESQFPDRILDVGAGWSSVHDLRNLPGCCSADKRK